MADIQQTTNKQHRMLKISILRFNPQDPESVPHMQTYELEESDSMTLFIALNELRDTQDPTLQFDFVCRAGICGSCAMMINGKPGLACRTLTRDLPTEFTLAPLPAFELIGDLSVNTGKWMRNMSERMETWVHMKEEEVDLRKKEVPMDRSSPKTSTFSTAAWNAAAVSPVAVRFASARTSSAALASTRSPASVSTRATRVTTPTTTISSVTNPACSAACPSLPAMTSARRNFP